MRYLSANCVLQVARFAVVAFVLTCFVWSIHVHAASADPNDHLSFCKFGPKVTIVHSPGTKSSSDPCMDRVHVQAVQWKCGSAETVATDSADFLSRLNGLADQECRRYCKSLGSNCVASLSNIPQCGLGTDRATAVELGKRLGCRSDCTDGRAFTYCSLFNAGFNGLGTDAVQSDTANCECRSRP